MANTSDRRDPGVVERRSRHAFDFLSRVIELKMQGKTNEEVAIELHRCRIYIGQAVVLIGRGDPKLIAAVDDGRIPLSVAMQIAKLTRSEDRLALQRAYEIDGVRGHPFAALRRKMERAQPDKHRRVTIRDFGQPQRVSKELEENAALVATRDCLTDARHARERLQLLRSTYSRLFEDREFRTLLLEQGMQTGPAVLVASAD